jgi:hypothetical protein
MKETSFRASSSAIDRVLNSNRSKSTSSKIGTQKRLPITPTSRPISRQESKDEFIQKYLNKKRRTTMVISQYLDEDLRKRLEKLKYKSKQTEEKAILAENECHAHHFNYNEEATDLQSLGSSSESLTSGDSDLKQRKKKSIEKLKTLSFKSKFLDMDDEFKPKTIRFGSTLSRDAQFALLKSLEDQIIQEISFVYPNIRLDDLPRTSTADFQKILKRKLYNTSKNEVTSSIDSQLYMTRTIEEAMQILDTLRHKKRLIQKAQSLLEQDNQLEDLDLDIDLDKEYIMYRQDRKKQSYENALKKPFIDPVVKFEQWCFEWISQLEDQ